MKLDTDKVDEVAAEMVKKITILIMSYDKTHESIIGALKGVATVMAIIALRLSPDKAADMCAMAISGALKRVDTARKEMGLS
jgi:hypothetical protein